MAVRALGRFLRKVAPTKKKKKRGKQKSSVANGRPVGSRNGGGKGKGMGALKIRENSLGKKVGKEGAVPR